MATTIKKKKSPKAKDIEAKPMKIEDNQGNVLANYSKEMIDTIRKTVAAGATDEELYMFLSIANNYQLDPFRREIWFIKYRSNDKPQIYTSRDGMVKIASQNPDFDKIQSNAVYENDVFEVSYENFEISNFKHTFSAKDRGKIIGAWASISYKTKKPIFVYVDFEESVNKNNPLWKSNGSSMIRKVAEKEVCRLSSNISGLYIEEEIKDIDDIKISEDFRREKTRKLKQTQQRVEDKIENESAIIDAEIIEKGE